jgi:outer membrane protein with beta-barrel domain
VVRVIQSLLAVAVAAGVARADPEPEAGVFAGTFLSNFYHQFYDETKWTPETRPTLSKVSPLLGARYAYWAWPMFGVEGEGTIAIAGVDGHDDTAKLYGLRVQALLQYPGLIQGTMAPFVALGAGLLHTSSNTLGSDTDVPIHVGAGLRYFVTPAFAVRFDARFIRGPADRSPFTLAASYGEFAVGVSWVPQAGMLHVEAE